MRQLFVVRRLGIVLAAMSLPVACTGGGGSAPLPVAVGHPNGPIVFVKVVAFHHDVLNDADVFQMDPDGSSLHRLTRNVGLATSLAVSPDGESIAYASASASPFPSGFHTTYRIVVMNRDGSNPRVVHRCNYCSDLAWSPDGERLAFASSGVIVTMNADGTDVRRICATACAPALAEPVWSPDGSQLVFSQRGVLGWHGLGLAASAIWIADATGGDVRKLTNRDCDPAHGAADCWFDTEAAWSPDGRQIAFSRTPSTIGRQPGTAPVDQTGVYITDADGTQPSKLWSCPRQDCQVTLVRWSPDGTALAVAGDPEHPTIDIVSAATGRRIGTTTVCPGRDCGFLRALAWSPDSTALVLTGHSRKETSWIYTVRSDGTHLRLLRTYPDEEGTGEITWATTPSQQAGT